MKKIVYSLVLEEDVIREVDRRAHVAGTSRSSLINQLLADQMGLLTDPRRMGEIFAHARTLAGDTPGLQLALQTDTVLTVRAALCYKYNPSMRYSVSVERSGRAVTGTLKATMRSQNRELLFHLRRFLGLWDKMEQAYGGSPRTLLEGARFTRHFSIPPHMEADRRRQAGMIMAYITAMNAAFGGYFAHEPDMPAAAKAIEALYLEYLRSGQDVL